jgi:TonB family protein
MDSSCGASNWHADAGLGSNSESLWPRKNLAIPIKPQPIGTGTCPERIRCAEHCTIRLVTSLFPGFLVVLAGFLPEVQAILWHAQLIHGQRLGFMPLYEHEQNRALGMRRSLSPVPVTPEQKQRRQMLTALGLLVMALALVIFKNKEFWFPPAQVAQVETTSQPATFLPAAATTTTAPIAEKHHRAATHKVKTAVAVASVQPEATGPNAPVVNRAVLPPLEIEVVSGNEAQAAQERNNSVGLDMSAGARQTAAQAPSAGDVVNNASQSSERVRLSTDTAQVLTHPVEPNYPLLAKEMKVQGSVVLQALIGKDGKIQDLRTVSGPAILSSAAREAVQQWRFKPYYQSGQAVETVARITVNFTISAN